MKYILDAACGSRMFWFDKANPNVTFMDNRQHYEKLPTGHIVDVNLERGICRSVARNWWRQKND
ncbi:hypothetical protein G8J22_01306 [Lentilactobacillus hilgardii]|nr:hypothetical protein HMPREF0497_2345 [Lentilactobacillus buchneri ATCC 11577]QIR09327.1 hypothetical protein G8J22_01306 [Lentilactobacillus hilgardii]